MDNITSEPLPPRVKDIRGMKFNRLTAVSFVRLGDNGGASRWLFQCECGIIKEADSSSVRHGSSKSCGCLKKEKTTKHGHYGTPTYASWQAMKERCLNPNHVHYYRYGGRGITICAEWLGPDDFPNFLRDMGERPNGTTLDRIKNGLGYFKGNCRWSTPLQQRMNASNVRIISWRGENRQIDEWANITGLKVSTIRERIKRGWSIDDALSQAATKRKLIFRSSPSIPSTTPDILYSAPHQPA